MPWLSCFSLVEPFNRAYLLHLYLTWTECFLYVIPFFFCLFVFFPCTATPFCNTLLFKIHFIFTFWYIVCFLSLSRFLQCFLIAYHGYKYDWCSSVFTFTVLLYSVIHPVFFFSLFLSLLLLYNKPVLSVSSTCPARFFWFWFTFQRFTYVLLPNKYIHKRTRNRKQQWCVKSQAFSHRLVARRNPT